MKKQGPAKKPKNWEKLSPADQGDWLFMHKHYAEAITTYRTVLRYNPHDTLSWRLLSESHEKLGNTKAAIRCLKQSLRANPDCTLAMNYLGTLYNKTDQDYRAFYWYKRAYEHEPDKHNAESLGTAAYNIARFDYALKIWNKALEIAPDDAAIHQHIGNLHYEIAFVYCWTRKQQCTHLQKAIPHFEHVCAQNPKDHKLLVKITDCYFTLAESQKNPDAYKQKALEYIDAALSLAPKKEKYIAAKAEITGSATNYWLHQIKHKNLLNRPTDATSLQNASYWLSEDDLYNDAYATNLRAREIEDEQIRKKALKSAPGQSAHPVEILTATIDLKLTPEGRIKIFEFNDGWCSGCEGFEKLTGWNMQADFIEPGILHDIKPELRRRGHKFRSIKMPEDSVGSDFTYLSDSALTPDNRIFVNANTGFNAICRNKDLMSLLMPDNVLEYFPKTCVLPIGTLSEDAIETLLKSGFAGENPPDTVVIKPPDSYQGRGVAVLPFSEAAAYIARIPQRNFENDHTGKFWNTHPHSTILVQECVRSHPVRAGNGKFYDGTMRVAFSAVLDPQRDMPDIYFHCAWWKLPARPVDSADALDRDHVVSVAPCTLDGSAKDDHVFSARVYKRERNVVESRLRECLPHYLSHVAASPRQMAGLAQRWLSAENRNPDTDVLRAIATRIATSREVGDHIVLAGGPDLKAAFIEQINKNERHHPAAPDAVFMRTLRESFMPQDKVSPLQFRAAEHTANYLAIDLKPAA